MISLKQYCHAYIRMLRPYQWIKNGFVLVGVIFGHAFHHIPLLISALTATLAFCLLSSSVYIYNDIIDRAEDECHPTKKHRPLASKVISTHTAMTLSVLLLVCSFILGFTISLHVTLFLFGYFLLNIFYTHWLKNMVILDVFAISAGFMLRILTGTIGLNITPSPWLLFCGLCLTLFLGFTKRRAEIEHSPSFRKILKKYSAQFLDKMIVISASCSIITYALYTMNPETQLVHHTKNLIYTVPFVVYGIFRYLYLLHDETLTHRKGEDTAKDLLTDKPLLMSVLGWLILMIIIIT
jgi:4-hydroxybenzoate polyprenyltransferase